MKWYWHGGVPGLSPGDLLQPGYPRQLHDGCEFCAARANGMAVLGPDGIPIDPPSKHGDRIYVTTDKAYARFYASLYGRGDLYKVRPIGTSMRSAEDRFPTWVIEAGEIIEVVERSVLLTTTQRSKLNARWAEADAIADAAGHTA